MQCPAPINTWTTVSIICGNYRSLIRPLKPYRNQRLNTHYPKTQYTKSTLKLWLTMLLALCCSVCSKWLPCSHLINCFTLTIPVQVLHSPPFLWLFIELLSYIALNKPEMWHSICLCPCFTSATPKLLPFLCLCNCSHGDLGGPLCCCPWWEIGRLAHGSCPKSHTPPNSRGICDLLKLALSVLEVIFPLLALMAIALHTH